MPKNRGVVLVRDLNPEDDEIAGVAITGTFTKPPANTEIVLHYKTTGHEISGLNKESVAVCTWPVVVHRDRILSDSNRVYRVSAPQLVEIIRIVNELYG